MATRLTLRTFKHKTQSLYYLCIVNVCVFGYIAMGTMVKNLVIKHQSTPLRRNCTSNQNWACLKYNMIILKQIAREIQKWYWHFSRPSGSWDIDQNVQNIVLINSLRTAAWRIRPHKKQSCFSSPPHFWVPHHFFFFLFFFFTKMLIMH